MFLGNRPRDLSYRSRNGIFYVILSREFNDFQFTIKNISNWSKSSSPTNSKSVDGFRLLDTFLSDTLNSESLALIFRLSFELKIPVKLLLVNPNTQFAIARNNSLENTISTKSPIETRARIGIRELFIGIYKSLDLSYSEAHLDTLNYEQLLLNFNQIKSERSLSIELRFYTVVPSGPMFFLQDILLSGFYCAGLSSRDLPWLVIVDDPNTNNDMYDEFSNEFQRIWDMSSESREDTSSPFYAYSYFISYASEDAGTADHIELLLWRRNRLVNRDENKLFPGRNLSENIEELITKSQTFLFLCSEISNQSLWCRGEIEVAFTCLNSGRITRIVVISLDGSRPQDLRLRTFLYLQGRDRTERESSIQRMVEREAS